MLESFYFTQNSIKTFEICPNRFKYRYVDQLYFLSYFDPQKQINLNDGRDFHQIAQRYFMGIDCFDLLENKGNNNLRNWYKSLTDSFVIDKKAEYFPEFRIKLEHENSNLEAIYDLIIKREDELQIWDFKTGILKNNEKQADILENSLQTMIYLYILKEKLSIFSNNKKCNISMYYWRPFKPHIIKEIKYSEEIHELFKIKIKDILQTIQSYDYTNFDTNEYLKACSTCEYIKICEKVNNNQN